jgi:hypothetical protein
MRAVRIAGLLFVILSLIGGTAVAAIAATPDTEHSIVPVAGRLTVQQLPGGTFDVEDRVFQYREFPVAGSSHLVSDSRLSGYMLSEWNWDVQASGNQPVPAWGTMTIKGDDGSWTGEFTAIQSSGFQPIDVRAVLFGDGGYDGMCATLDITALELARGDTWTIDGIVHPVDSMG